MSGHVALALGIGFVLLTALRLRRNGRWLVAAAAASGLIGGGLAIAHRMGGADSRWLAGGLLLAAGGIAAPLATRIPALRVAAPLLGVLATLLLAIATGTARPLP